ncbi:MAG: hypothetical protein M1837_004302 [Sclerophora amabilis]|nr:MAG: hypothetical protein M1837_004302 [Sclerophora amabilis]
MRLLQRPQTLFRLQRHDALSPHCLDELPRFSQCRHVGPTFALQTPPRRTLAHVQEGSRALPAIWFTSSRYCRRPEISNNNRDKPPDERTLKLGKTLRILQSRLPTLLQTPLPQEILSPQISLHLFPSTHPHLPTATGRVSYVAALWTAPMAWGRVPIVGNVRLRILSERMVPSSPPSHSLAPSPTWSGSKDTSSGNSGSNGYRSEKLLVRWTTMGKSRRDGQTTPAAATRARTRTGGSRSGVTARDDEDDHDAADRITRWFGFRGGEWGSSSSSSSSSSSKDHEFTGLFIFEFDEEGRIVRHTIERAEAGGLGGLGEAATGKGVFGLGEWLWRRVGRRGQSDAEPDGDGLPAGLPQGVYVRRGL